MFNPQQYSINKTNQFASISIPGRSSSIIQFVKGDSETLSFELFFDTYTYENGVNVRNYTDKLKNLMDINPKIHAPPDGEILVARLDGKVVGCVMMQPIDERTCEMKRMFVSPEGRGTGLGRRLAESIMQAAVGRGYTTMRLDTGRNHYEAIKLYRSLGFEEITPYYEAPPELGNHLIFMEAPVGSSAVDR